jgi:hypothetical protein
VIERVVQEIEHPGMGQSIGVVAQLESLRRRARRTELHDHLDVDLISRRPKLCADIGDAQERQFPARLE